MRSCAVTGANGFIGSHVVRALLERGYQVTALVGADMGLENLAGLDVDMRAFDLLDAAGVRRALAGCDAVVHAAACYAFWLPDSRDFYRINVEGTRHVLTAARELGVRKLVHTSSAATLSPGFGAAGTETEEDVFDLSAFRGHYKMSKVMAEMVALREAARGLPVVIVHPTTVLGPGDRRPTPTGTIVVHFLKRHMKAYANIVQNLVDVRDVAQGHVLALETGRPGERYVLGGENLMMREILAMLADITGMPAPRIAIPPALLRGLARINESLSQWITHHTPLIAREAALHARDSRAFDCSKAQQELGYGARPAREVLVDAVRWFAAEGYCSRATAERVLQRPALTAPAGARVAVSTYGRLAVEK
jgi:dihydroflavonol-4-reductase